MVVKMRGGGKAAAPSSVIEGGGRIWERCSLLSQGIIKKSLNTA